MVLGFVSLRNSHVRNTLCALTGLTLFTLASSLQITAATVWPQISKEEMAMTDDPKNPGAPAILLYREVTTEDRKKLQTTEYRRIKILTDAGQKFADIEIRTVPGLLEVEDIQARTIAADGQITPFTGQILDKTVLRYGKRRLQVKTLTLPHAQKGAILEYFVTTRFKREIPDVLVHPENYRVDRSVTFPTITWVMQEDLFTRRARFVLHPLKRAIVKWTMVSAFQQFQPVRDSDGSVSLEVENIPAFVEEPLSLPDMVIRPHVNFYYVPLQSPVLGPYWEDVAHDRATRFASFIEEEPKRFRAWLDDTIRTGDSPEEKLRKIYSRVQRIRQVTSEESRSLKANKSTSDLLRHGYAWGNEINLAFVALVRAAGIDAFPLLLRERDDGVFVPELPDDSQLNAMVVYAAVGAKRYYLDPANPFSPFGLLSWPQTGTGGIAVDTSARESYVITTPGPESSQSVIRRNATLRLDEDGSLEGAVTVAHVGQSAMYFRSAMKDLKETERKELLEKDAALWEIPELKAELTAIANLDDLEQPLQFSYSIKVANFATLAGRRLMLRCMFFKESGSAAQSPQRSNAVYYPYPYEYLDSVQWTFPEGRHITAKPETVDSVTQFGTYKTSIELTETGLKAQRRYTQEVVYIPATFYSALRGYLNTVRLGDDSQVVLEKSGAR